MKKRTRLVRPIFHFVVALALLSACTSACANGDVAGPRQASDTATVSDSAAPLGTADSGTDARLPSDSAVADASTCASPCDLVAQCGCGIAETCDLDERGTSACVLAGNERPGRPCLSTRECARGLVCANQVCRAPCETLGAACPGANAGSCTEYPRNESDAGAPIKYSACAVPCNYADEAACGFTPGDLLAVACVYRPTTNTTECLKVRNVQLQSGVCNADAECGAGRVCIPSTGFSSCRRLCKVGDPNACGGCGPFTPTRVVAGVTYGFCP